MENPITYRFDDKKTLNIILYIVERLKRHDIHKLFKILYFADRESLYEYGKPITGDMYIAMNAGPVPSKTYDIVKIVRGDAYAQDTTGELGKYFAVENWCFIRPLKKSNPEIIPIREKEIIDKTISKYGDLSFDEIKEKSHDTAWRSTAQDRPMSFKNIAMEAGLEDEDLGYIAETAELQKTFL